MNSPAKAGQQASLVDSSNRADAYSDDALPVSRCVNGECHWQILPMANIQLFGWIRCCRFGAGPEVARDRVVRTKGAAATHSVGMAVDALHHLDIWRRKKDDLPGRPEGDPPAEG
jgi:hypothetical protein